jgi:hypothetical protein
VKHIKIMIVMLGLIIWLVPICGRADPLVEDLFEIIESDETVTGTVYGAVSA